MARKALNIPKDDDRFREIEFVEKMTPGQLKVLVKRIWNNIQDLANALDDSRTDISAVLDRILDGGKWKESDIDERVHFGKYRGFTIAWDSRDKTFTLMDQNYRPIEKPIRGIPGRETVNRLARKTREGK